MSWDEANAGADKMEKEEKVEVKPVIDRAAKPPPSA